MIIEHGSTISSSDELTENKIIGDLHDETSTITFKGKNNILCLDGDVRLTNCEISFLSDDAVIYLTGHEKKDYKLKMESWRSSFIYIGAGNYFNNTMTMISSERKGIVIGGGGVFSFGIWIRTADPHILYDSNSHDRINPSKNVLIGDHVWLGQNALILKGSTIGSGSTIGAASVVSGKRIESNTIYAGNPVRKVKENVFFTDKSVHNYTKKKTQESMHFNGNDFIYTNTTDFLDEEQLFKAIEHAGTSDERLSKIKELLAENDSPGRFSVANKSAKSASQGRRGFFRK